MTTQTLETTTFFTLNTPKLHDQLDHLRAELNALARENNLGDAFHDGHLADALSDTDLGKRYQSLTRRLDILAKLPAKRTLISAGIVGGSVAWLAHRRGWDAQAIAGFKKTGAKLNRAARNLRARLTRRNPDEFPQNFNTPASAAMREKGICAQDPPEIVALFESVQQKYPHADVRNLFARATATLLESVNTGYADTVGTVYMAINAENKYAGQYFTPYPIASLMAHLNIDEGPRRVIERIIQAVNRAIDSPNAPATLKASRLMGRLSALRDNENLRKADFPDDMPLWLAEHWQLIRPHFHPLTINDPAVGSGVMLLAAAELFPKWMLQLGFVQFYGQDIDELCVLMANINIKLYGLNGFGAQMMHALVGTPRIQKGTQRLAEEKL